MCLGRGGDVVFLRLQMQKDAKNKKEQGLVEYALLVALIAIVALTSLTELGSKIRDTFGGIEDEVTQTSCGADDCMEPPVCVPGPFSPPC